MHTREQAADAVLEDYFKTVDILSEVAGTIREPDEPELRERGLKKIFPYYRRLY